jgi:cytochrome P450
VIAAVPVTAPAEPPVRMVFLSCGPGAAPSWQAWADRMGPAVDGRIATPGDAAADLTGLGRPVPTVLVAAGKLVADALDLCRQLEYPPELLVIAPGPGATPGPGEPVAVPLTVLACDGDGTATRWQRASTQQTAVRLFGTSPDGLLAPDSPAVPALIGMLRIGPKWFPPTADRPDRRPAIIFPVTPSDPYAPPAEYHDAPGAPPRLVTLAYGGQAWLVTRYRDARALLADTSFSSDSTRPGYPSFPLASKQHVPGHFLAMDPPEHTRLRKLVAAEFTAGAVRGLRPAIEHHARALVTAMAAGDRPADLIVGVAMPLPALVAAELLGVPAQGRPLFQAIARDLQMHDATSARRRLAGGRMNRYLSELTEQMRHRHDGSVFGRLTVGGALTAAELVGIANLILVAGLETTAGLLGLTVLALLRNPQQRALVRADPQQWAEGAVCEALRYWTVVHHGVARVATREVEVSGQLIRPGEAVVIHLPTANRDPVIYPEPATFDITRDAHAHLSFGHGVHRCLGGPLAQAEATTALTELMRRLPGLKLADPAGEPPFLHDMLVYGLRQLLVTW